MSGTVESKKDDYEKEEEEVERLLDESPEDKPPRDDRSRDYIDTGDPDVDDDPDVGDDDDLSMNYKDIGGSIAARYASEHPHPPQKPSPVVGEPFDLSDEEMASIIVSATEWIEGDFIEDLRRQDPRMAERIALDYAIWTENSGRYYRGIDTPTYNALLRGLREIQENQ